MSLSVVPLYAGLAGFLFLVLSVRVVRLRRTLRVNIGDGGKPALVQAIRAHGNFIEYVPLTLLLLLLLEIAGKSHTLLHLLGIALLLGRMAHAYGLSTSPGASPGRLAGMLLTWSSLGVAAGLCLVTTFSVRV